ncbi:hypothetical protein QEH42_gp197 [Microbacterium phage Pumpernickel]|uniref:Uncharacterized protein n=1 Tax=Microbacterium phage Pumpernickel TaxID=2885983 RepID=A0AAE9C305_9CAUD|nr:hypothetical protein QEH42_gp197 [Microbacterium phage Pumpernickel]UDL16021.1 hypothetical protein SEA_PUMPERNICKEL_271 [Microbacterium phage Pumpernickel]
MSVTEAKDINGDPMFVAESIQGNTLQFEKNFQTLEAYRTHSSGEEKYYILVQNGSKSATILLGDEDMMDLFQGWLALREDYRRRDEAKK